MKDKIDTLTKMAEEIASEIDKQILLNLLNLAKNKLFRKPKKKCNI